MKILITVLLTALGFVPFAWCDAEIDESASEVHCTITINISDLRNDDGQIAALLFSSEDGFPSDEDKGVHSADQLYRGRQGCPDLYRCAVWSIRCQHHP